jgi:hypothetical protein
VQLSEVEIARRIAAEADHGALSSPTRTGVTVTGPGMVAVLPLSGIIAQKASMVNNTSGPRGTSTEAFGASLDAVMADPADHGGRHRRQLAWRRHQRRPGARGPDPELPRH